MTETVRENHTPEYGGGKHLLFCFYDTAQSLFYLSHGQRRESEPSTPALNGRDDLVNIVTDNAEADVFGVLFDDTSKGSLGLLRHHVGLIQNDEFVSLGKQRSCFCELFDLLSDNIYATFIGRIEL